MSCFILWFRFLLSWIVFIWIFVLLLWYNRPDDTRAPCQLCENTHAHHTRHTPRHTVRVPLCSSVTSPLTPPLSTLFSRLSVRQLVCCRQEANERTVVSLPLKQVGFLIYRLDRCLSEYRHLLCPLSHLFMLYKPSVGTIVARELLRMMQIARSISKNQHSCKKSECVVRKCHRMTGKFFSADTCRTINPLTCKLWRTSRWLKGLWPLERICVIFWSRQSYIN